MVALRKLTRAATLHWTLASCAETQESPIESPLGVVLPTRGRPILARLDPDSLEPVPPHVFVGEYHWTSSLSPDGSRLALGLSAPRLFGRTGIAIVDLERMETAVEVDTGIAAEAVAWLSPKRIVAALQRGGVLLVDAPSGAILRRWPDSFRPPNADPKPVERTSDGVLFLLAHPSEVAPAKLVLIDESEKLHSVSLSHIEVALGEAGLTVDTANNRAFVVGPEPTLAEVDLDTMEVQYHDVEGLERRRSPWSFRQARWLGDGMLAVFGHDRVPKPGGRTERLPTGVTVIDASTWRARTIDAAGSKAEFDAGRLLVYGRRLTGLRAYAADGRELFDLFGDERIREVHIGAEYTYVLGASALHVLDASSGTVVRALSPSVRLLELIDTSR